MNTSNQNEKGQGQLPSAFFILIHAGLFTNLVTVLARVLETHRAFLFVALDASLARGTTNGALGITEGLAACLLSVLLEIATFLFAILFVLTCRGTTIELGRAGCRAGTSFAHAGLVLAKASASGFCFCGRCGGEESEAQANHTNCQKSTL